MIRSLLLATTIALAPLSAGLAVAASPVEAAFGNTIVSTYPSGRSTRLWLKRDGTYEAQRTNGKRTAGKWTYRGGKVCLRQTRPVTVPLTFCSPVPSGKVGTRWSGKSPKGEPLNNRLVAGRG